MKTIHYLLFAPLLCFFACTKDPAGKDPVPPGPVDTVQHVIELGKVSVLRDSFPWSMSWKTTLSNTYPPFFYLTAKKIYSYGLSETFSIGDIPLKIGKYKIEALNIGSEGNYVPDALIGWVLDGDQVLGGLNTDESDLNNFIEILRFDSLLNTVEGRFQVHLINDWGSTNGSIYPLPDSMRLTDGKFYLKLN